VAWCKPASSTPRCRGQDEASGDVKADDGCAVVYATQYLAEIESIGASIAVHEAGRISGARPGSRSTLQ
jgi:hypothetical protein